MTVLLLCAVFALCIYRAATQSFTIDESFTFLRFVDVRLGDTLTEYTSNNHLLQSLLMVLFRRVLGRSELVLRIPTLIGALLFLTASYRIATASIGTRWFLPLAVLLMTLNPLVLDLLVAARGYALALGLSWWSFYLSWAALENPNRKLLWLAGVSAGLAITANLVFVIPLAMWGLLLLLFYTRCGRFWELIDSFAGPAIVIPFVLLLVPLTRSAGQFYFGVKSLAETTGSLLGESVRQPIGGTLVFDVLGRSMPNFWDVLVEWIIPTVLFGIAITAVWFLFDGVRNDNRKTGLLGLVLGTVSLSVGCWAVMHHFLGVLYPLTRTALYMLPLMGFGCVLTAALARRRSVSIGLASFAMVIGTIYVSELRTRYFSEWRSEAGMKHLVQELAKDAQELHKTRPVIAGGTWDLEYSVRYYRARYRMGWLKVLDAEERKTIQPDYYVLGPSDGALINTMHLRVIARDDVSGTVLARRS